MRWEDERYVRVYTSDTAEWIALGWEAQSLFLALVRKVDRAGIMSLGKLGLRGVAGVTRFPLEVVERAMPILLDDGCVRQADGALVIPNYIAAQETPQSDKVRKREQRERARSIAVTESDLASRNVTDGHAESREVTAGHSVLIRSVLSLAEPSTHSAGERGGHAGELGTHVQLPDATPPVASDPAQPEEPPGEVDRMARELATAGNKFAVGIVAQIENLETLTKPQRAMVRKIHAEHSEKRSGRGRHELQGGIRDPVRTAEIQAVTRKQREATYGEDADV